MVDDIRQTAVVTNLANLLPFMKAKPVKVFIKQRAARLRIYGYRLPSLKTSIETP